MNPVVLNVIVDEFVELNEHFAGVATGEGLAPLLLAMGTLLVIVSLAVFGALTVGAFGSLFTRA